MITDGATRGHLAMLLFSVLVAGSFSFGNRIANMMDPTALMAIRFLVAGALIGAFAFGLRLARKEHFAAPWRFLVLGGIFASYFVLMFWGLRTASPISTAAVFTLIPLLSAIFGYVVMRQVTTPRMALALLIGALGALWVVFDGDLAALLRFDIGRGEMIYFIGCIAHAIYPVLVKKLGRGEPALVATFGMLCGGTVLLFVVSWGELISTDYAQLPPYFWAVLAYIAVISSAVTFFLLQVGSVNLPAANVMAYTYLTPAWVILLEALLTGRFPPAVIFWGIAATFVSLVLLLCASPQKR